MSAEYWPRLDTPAETKRLTPAMVTEQACYQPRGPIVEEAAMQGSERSEAEKLLAEIGYEQSRMISLPRTERSPVAQYPQLHSDVLAAREAEKPLFDRLSAVIDSVRGKVGDIVESAVNRISRIVESIEEAGWDIKENLSTMIEWLIEQRDYTSVRNMWTFFQQHGPQFLQVAEKWGQDPVKLCALIAGESKFSATALNPSTGAHGLWQMTPDAWKDACKHAGRSFQRSNPLHQIEATCAYMQMIEKQGEKRGQSLSLLDTSALYHRGPYVNQEWPVSSNILRRNEAIATPYKTLVQNWAPANNATYLAASVLFYFGSSLPRTDLLESSFVQKALWAAQDGNKALDDALQAISRQKSGKRA